MAWQEKSLVDLRLEFVKLAEQDGANISLICKRFGISRKTGYKWLSRYEELGLNGLENQSTKPHSSPDSLPERVIDSIVEIRKRHPAWGGRKIQAVLKRGGVTPLPAPSTITKYLEKYGYLDKEKKQRRHLERFEHETPNRLWQMDFKGHFEYEKGRCHPLTILDDHSRYSICLEACQQETGKVVKPILIKVFKKYGMPERINVDNGNPWGSLFEFARYTTLSVWLIELGVNISYSRPGHPQTNGKDERFHRTLKEEVLKYNYFRDIKHIQKKFNQWQKTYNFERPHEAINMEVPGDRYQPSYREYSPKIKPFEYSSDYVTRKVDSRGRTSYQNRQIYVGTPFSGQIVGLRPGSHEDERKVFFRQQELGKLDLRKLPKSHIINLYSKKISQV